MANPFFRWRIPASSHFNVKVDGVGDANQQAFTVSGHFQGEAGASANWNDDELRAGQDAELAIPGSYYRGHVEIVFEDTAEASIRMEVVKADDSRHGDLYEETVTGNAGTVDRAYFMLVTLKDQ